MADVVYEQELRTTLTADDQMTRVIEHAEDELDSFSESAKLLATRLSKLFGKEQVNKAQKLANVYRTFDTKWESDVAQGMSNLFSANNVDELGRAFSQLTTTQASAISGLVTDSKKGITQVAQRLNAFSEHATRSLHRFKTGLDRIANIIRYRLIRQGLSLIVSQLSEGTKNVYIFARAFKNLDKNNLAENLDKYATAFDKIRGNLGAAWATILSGLSNILLPFLERISDAIEKVTAFAAAMNNSSTYMKVATDNVKRYYNAVASGLQDIKVLGSKTRFDEAEVPTETAEFASKIRDNLGNIGSLTGGIGAGLALILIGTGHVVAGLEVGAAALGITNWSNQVDSSDTGSKIEQIFKDVGEILPSIELGLGLLLSANGKFAVGIPLILKGASGMLDKLGDFDFEGDLKKKLKIADATIDAISLGLGAILCYFGKYDYGVPLLLSGLVSTGMDIAHNWDDIMDAFESLGKRIEIWWWALWNDMIGASWEEKVTAFYDAFPEKVGINKDVIGSSTKQLSNLDDYLPDNVAEQVASKVTEKLSRDDLFKSSLEFSLNGVSSNGERYDLWTDFWTDFPTFLKRFPDAYFANGGFPSAGSIFLAGEVPGQTELLGTINGRTGVAGGAEITGIREAIYQVGAEILSGMQNNNVNVTLEGDADRLFKVVRSKAVDYNRRTGEFAF